LSQLAWAQEKAVEPTGADARPGLMGCGSLGAQVRVPKWR
jgi:hypothetical protein